MMRFLMRSLSRFASPARAALACAALLSPGLAAAQPVAIDRVVAVVNDSVITSSELRDRIQQTVRQLQRQGVQLPEQDVLARQLLERLILERAQLKRAEETGLKVDDAMLARAVGRIAENNRISEEQLRATLQEDGISWNRFRNEVRTEILLSQLREREVESRVVVSEAEVDNFLASNPAAFSGTEVRVAHILLRLPESPTQADVDAVSAKADEALRRLQAGEPFNSVATEFSEAPDAIEGGVLDWRDPNRLPGLFAEAVSRLKPGQISPVLRSAAGLHIVQLMEVRGTDGAGPLEMQQTHVRHILLRTSEVMSDQEAESRLQGLRERVVHGHEDFADLARANSADLSAANGGDIGWVNPGDTVPEFERVMDSLTPMAVSEPVKSPFGWHLIQVVERRMQDVSQERKRNTARAALRERKADEAFDDWLRQLRDETYVEYRLDSE